MSNTTANKIATDEKEMLEKVIQIDRVNKVVKGGKRLSFRAMVVVGDLEGRVSIAIGKAKEVPSAIRKGISRAKKGLHQIKIVNDTIPHPVEGKFGSAKVILKPARPGTGVIGGGPVRILLEASGIRNIVAKSLGSDNSYNTANAALNALSKLKDVAEEEAIRGKKIPVYFYDPEKHTTPEAVSVAPVEKKDDKKSSKKAEAKPKKVATKTKKVAEEKSGDKKETKEKAATKKKPAAATKKKAVTKKASAATKKSEEKDVKDDEAK